MWCQSCKGVYDEEDAGTCKECYEEASETEEELKREIDDLRSRLLFLRLPSPTFDATSTGHSDLLLHAIPASLALHSGDGDGDAGRPDTPAIPAHRVILLLAMNILQIHINFLEELAGDIGTAPQH